MEKQCTHSRMLDITFFLGPCGLVSPCQIHLIGVVRVQAYPHIPQTGFFLLTLMAQERDQLKSEHHMALWRKSFVSWLEYGLLEFPAGVAGCL